MDSGPAPGRADAVVLDIGGDTGALVVYTTERWAGTEVDLTPAGAPRSHHVHTMVRRRRRLAGGDTFAGVYPALPAGRYTIWGSSRPLGEVEVEGGRVAAFDAGDLS